MSDIQRRIYTDDPRNLDSRRWPQAGLQLHSRSVAHPMVLELCIDALIVGRLTREAQKYT